MYSLYSKLYTVQCTPESRIKSNLTLQRLDNLLSVYNTLNVHCTRWRKETDYYQYHNNMNLFKEVSTVDVISNDPPPHPIYRVACPIHHETLSSDQHWRRNRRFSIRFFYSDQNDNIDLWIRHAPFFRNVTWIACLRVLEITARNPLFISNSPS